MQVTSEGSVRVDLVGGTLDLEPINLILPNVVTLNVATSLKAKVTIEKISEEKIIIESLDYKKTYKFSLEEMTTEKLHHTDHFKEMSFVLQIVHYFNIKSGLKISLKSGAPPGSGLGGSSAMGMTLLKALCKLSNQEFEVNKAVSIIKGIEGRILNQGVPGYQDYYPAMLGGILCLRGLPGEISYEQLYSKELASFLEEHITLVYSGISRNSGINNWDVYKGFFDGTSDVRSGMNQIAEISFEAYNAIKDNRYHDLLGLIGNEGESRKSLAAGIVPDIIQDFQKECSSSSLIKGLKMCGAGGGGCFILTHSSEATGEIEKLLSKYKFEKLDFKIESPL